MILYYIILYYILCYYTILYYIISYHIILYYGIEIIRLFWNLENGKLQNRIFLVLVLNL